MHDIRPVSGTPALRAKLPAVCLCSATLNSLMRRVSRISRNNRQASAEAKMSIITRRHTLLRWRGRDSNPRPTDYESMYLVACNFSKRHKDADSDAIEQWPSRLEADIAGPSAMLPTYGVSLRIVCARASCKPLTVLG